MRDEHRAEEGRLRFETHKSEIVHICTSGALYVKTSFTIVQANSRYLAVRPLS